MPPQGGNGGKISSNEDEGEGRKKHVTANTRVPLYKTHADRWGASKEQLVSTV